MRPSRLCNIGRLPCPLRIPNQAGPRVLVMSLKPCAQNPAQRYKADVFSASDPGAAGSRHGRTQDRRRYRVDTVTIAEMRHSHQHAATPERRQGPQHRRRQARMPAEPRAIGPERPQQVASSERRGPQAGIDRPTPPRPPPEPAVPNAAASRTISQPPGPSRPARQHAHPSQGRRRKPEREAGNRICGHRIRPPRRSSAAMRRAPPADRRHPAHHRMPFRTTGRPAPRARPRSCGLGRRAACPSLARRRRQHRTVTVTVIVTRHRYRQPSRNTRSRPRWARRSRLDGSSSHAIPAARSVARSRAAGTSNNGRRSRRSAVSRCAAIPAKPAASAAAQAPASSASRPGRPRDGRAADQSAPPLRTPPRQRRVARLPGACCQSRTRRETPQRQQPPRDAEPGQPLHRHRRLSAATPPAADDRPPSASIRPAVRVTHPPCRQPRQCHAVGTAPDTATATAGRAANGPKAGHRHENSAANSAASVKTRSAAGGTKRHLQR